MLLFNAGQNLIGDWFEMITVRTVMLTFIHDVFYSSLIGICIMNVYLAHNFPIILVNTLECACVIDTHVFYLKLY